MCWRIACKTMESFQVFNAGTFREALALFVALVIAALPVAIAAADAEQEAPSLEELLELDFEELIEMNVPVVYGASKFDQKALKAPASVTVITSEEIQLFGYRSLAEILSSMRGFYASNDRNYEYLGVRGLSLPGDYNTRVLILLNGQRMNEPVYTSSAVGYDFPLDVEIIDRIEVVRGPSSSLYGTNAVFAIVNIFTKKGGGIGGVEIAGEAASQDFYRGRLSYGNRFDNGLDLMVSVSVGDRGGHDRLYYPEFDDPETNNGIAEDIDDGDVQNFFASLDYRGFSLTAAHGSFNKTVPTAPWGTVFNDKRLNTEDVHTMIDLGYRTEVGSKSQLEASLYYGRYQYEGAYPYDWAEGPDDDPYIVLNRDKADATWAGGEVQLTTSLGERHRLIVGAMYEDQMKIDQSNWDEELYLNAQNDGSQWALFLQDEITLSDKWLLNLGLRYDDYETFGSTTNPRLALIFSPVQRTAIKLLYGSAFRAPSAYELYYHDGYFTHKPAGSLDPETIDTVELVWENYLGTNYLLTLSVFNYEIDDMIGFVADPEDELLYYENLGQVETTGAGVEIEGKWKNGVKARVSYSYQDSEDQASGERLSNSPQSMAKLKIVYPVLEEKLDLALEARYMSRRLGVFGGSTDSGVIANLNLRLRSLLPGLDITASIFNLFDETYYNPGSEEHTQEFIEQDGRTFRLRAIYRF